VVPISRAAITAVMLWLKLWNILVIVILLGLVGAGRGVPALMLDTLQRPCQVARKSQTIEIER
jgi:hypothetical protein